RQCGGGPQHCFHVVVSLRSPSVNRSCLAHVLLRGGSLHAGCLHARSVAPFGKSLSSRGARLRAIRLRDHLPRTGHLGEINMMLNVFAAVFVLFGAVLAMPAAAAQGWAPSRPVAFIAGSAAGGSLDLTARTLQRIWEQNQTVKP